MFLSERGHIFVDSLNLLVADFADLILAFDSFPSELMGCCHILEVKFLRTCYPSCMLQIVIYRTIA